MRKILLLLFLPVVLLANSVGEDNNAFTLALSAQMNERGNVVFSPYAIFSHLALLFYGAENATAQEIKNALHLTETGDRFLHAYQKHLQGLTRPAKEGYQIFIASALFPHQGTQFRVKYQDIAKEYFKAHLQPLDFTIPDSTLETINRWSSENTQGAIKQILTKSAINEKTRMVTASAAYFHGAWVYPFKLEKGNFTSLSGSTQEVDMLTRLHAFPYYENDRAQCLAIPIARSGLTQPELEFLIVLPKGNHKDFCLKGNELDQIFYHLHPTGIRAKLPKFCFSQTLFLNKALKDLGMKDAFTYQANFSKMDGIKDLFLNQVVHETFFAFHETGITSSKDCVVEPTHTPPPPAVEDGKDFIANRPFLFFLIDKHSRAVLFMGKVENPSKEICDED
jgi:serpin B